LMATTRMGYLVLVSIAILLLLSVVVVAIHPSLSIYTNGIRLAGLAGFSLLAIAAIMTPWVREIHQTFGSSFLSIHHLFSITGLILITLHPVLLAVRLMNALVFLPRLGSLQVVLSNAGRPSLILIYIALAGVMLRRVMPGYWRFFHALIWVALLLGIVHGNLVGTDMKNPIVFVTFNSLMAVALGAFLLKRFKRRAPSKSE